VKHLRQYIRSVLKEVAYNRRDAFLADLYGQDFDHNFIERGEDDEAYRRMAAAGRKMKIAFAAHADRQYLDSLKYVHWTEYGRRALGMLAPDVIKVDVNPRDELSAMAYKPGEIPGNSQFFGQYGLIITGHVTLLSNDMNSLQTGYTPSYKTAAPQRVASSGANKGISYAYTQDIVLSAEDWDPQGQLGNEALIDNWEIQGLIVPDSEYDKFVMYMDKIYEKTGKEYLLYKASQMS
tara:strand:- start:913 stop:1620 length:708 start_codon:yes stop_codon:yes gene_type:complete